MSNLLKRANVNYNLSIATHKFEFQNNPANKKSAFNPKNKCQIYSKHRMSNITILSIAIHKFKMTVILNFLSTTISVTNLSYNNTTYPENENKLRQINSK